MIPFRVHKQYAESRNTKEIKMFKTGMMRQVRAIISFAYVALIIGTGVFFAVLLERISELVSARGNSALDISKTHWLQGQESPKSSAMRLNAIWMRERSQA
jgi:hypothetical protein